MSRFFVILLLIFSVSLFINCGSEKNTKNAASSEAGETAEQAETKVDEGAGDSKSTTFENDFFTAEIPEGWTVFDDSRVKMMRIYPEGDTSMYAPTIHLKFEGNGNWAGTPEDSISTMAKNYNGTEPKKEVINGIEYWTTTYEYSGSKQTMYVAGKDGNKITVTIVGKDYETIPEIQEILKTISYK